MESNPEEFYGDASKWAFMFAPNFRDVMTEPEKGALHEALKEARRKEFDELVMRRILRDTEEETVKQARSSGAMSRGQVTTAIGTSLNDVFNQAYLGNSQQQEANKTYNALSHAAGQGLLGSGSTNYNPALNTQNPYK
jgi:hypothetical protein